MRPYKKFLLSHLEGQLEKQEIKKDTLLSRLKEARDEHSFDDSDLSIYNLSSEVEFLKTQVNKIRSTIRLIIKSRCKEDQKYGLSIRIGDCITLVTNDEEFMFYITNGTQYVDPKHGIISSETPFATKLLGNKFGDEVELFFQGELRQCKLMP